MKSNIENTVKSDLCLGCGICVDACPTNSIKIRTINGEYRPVVNNNTCINNKGCHKCSSVCPGLGVNLKKIGQERFGSQTNIRYHYLIGWYMAAYSGFALSEETRLHGASGGVLTAILSYMLDQGRISAAAVAYNDLSQPFLNQVRLVHKSDDLYKARSSKYCPVKFDGIINKIKQEPGKVVIVGLPCVIHAFRKAEEKDKKLKESVLGYFGLYCSCNRTFNLTEYVLKKYGVNKDELQYFQYRDNGCLGNMVARDNKKQIVIPFQLYYHPLRSFFIPNRCQLCIDHYSELADVSFGDIHFGKYKEDKIGVNSIVIRNSQFCNIIREACKTGYISLKELSETELIACQASAPKKKTLVGGELRFAKALGNRIPEYDVVITNYKYRNSIAYYLFSHFQMYIGRRRWLWWLIPLFVKKGNLD